MKNISPNIKIKAFFESLGKTYPQIEEETGIPRRTLQNIIIEGNSIKSDYLIILYQIYGLNPSEILLDENKFIKGKESDTTDNFTPGVNEENFPYLSSVNRKDLDDRQLHIFDSIARFLSHVKESHLPPEIKISMLDVLLHEADLVLNHLTNTDQ